MHAFLCSKPCLYIHNKLHHMHDHEICKKNNFDDRAYGAVYGAVS